MPRHEGEVDYKLETWMGASCLMISTFQYRSILYSSKWIREEFLITTWYYQTLKKELLNCIKKQRLTSSFFFFVKVTFNKLMATYRTMSSTLNTWLNSVLMRSLSHSSFFTFLFQEENTVFGLMWALNYYSLLYQLTS